MRHQLRMPDLSLPEVPMTVSVWLVSLGSEVTEGDRLVEILAGDVTVDLPSPASGVLVETFLVEDDPVSIGQTLGVIIESEPEPAP